MAVNNSRAAARAVKRNPNKAPTMKRVPTSEEGSKLKNIPTRNTTSKLQDIPTRNSSKMLSTHNTKEYDKNFTNNAYGSNYDPVAQRHWAENAKKESMKLAHEREKNKEEWGKASARNKSVRKAKATAKKTEARKASKK